MFQNAPWAQHIKWGQGTFLWKPERCSKLQRSTYTEWDSKFGAFLLRLLVTCWFNFLGFPEVARASNNVWQIFQSSSWILTNLAHTSHVFYYVPRCSKNLQNISYTLIQFLNLAEESFVANLEAFCIKCRRTTIGTSLVTSGKIRNAAQ